MALEALAPEPISIFAVPVVMSVPMLLPIQTLLAPVVIDFPALYPISALLLPEVVLCPAKLPIQTLFFFESEMLLEPNAEYPIATL